MLNALKVVNYLGRVVGFFWHFLFSTCKLPLQSDSTPGMCNAISKERYI